MVGDRCAALTVVVRFHDIRRTNELGRALFSLLCQPYRPLQVCLVTQGLSEREIAGLFRFIGHFDGLANGVGVSVINVDCSPGQDVRSQLLNAGIRASEGRFLAFLDYDDVIYTTLYPALIARLGQTDDALAFAGVAVKRVEIFGDAVLVSERTTPFGAGAGLIALWQTNHCPIHSFVIDRTRIPASELWFDTAFNRLEDYEFLLRMRSTYTCDFTLKSQEFADYYWKSDGSNTILQDKTSSCLRLEWDRARMRLDACRARARLSREVSARLCLRHAPPTLTIAQVLSRDNADRGIALGAPEAPIRLDDSGRVRSAGAQCSKAQ